MIRPVPTLRDDAPARRLLLGLVAALFLLRALVPVGFMPDANALRNGHLALSLCLSGLGEVLPDDHLPGAPGSAASSDECPFGLLTPPLAPPMSAPGIHMPLASATITGQPLPAQHCTRCGPPLGSRAPPAFLA